MLDVPFERDEGGYAYAGQLILQGIPPYREYYGMRLPGIYAIYAVCLAVFGQSHQGIHTALLIINSISIVLVFMLARHLGTRLCAVTSAASFALLSLSQSVYGASANTEHFVILFALGGLIALLRGLTSARRVPLFASGMLFGFAVLVKHHGLVFFALAAMYVLYDSWRQRPISCRVPALRLLSLTSGALVVLGGNCLIMAWVGELKSMWFWTVEYATTYVAHVSAEKGWQYFTTTFTSIFASASLLWILTGIGCLAFLTKTVAKQHRIFLLLFALCSILAICPGFYFRPHYFVLLLPCASIFAGVAISVFVDVLSKAASKKTQYAIPIALLVICLSESIYKQRDFLFQMTPFEITRSTYWPNPFSESLRIAEFIQKRTNPEDRIAIFGSEPQIFFYSKRRSASGHIHMYPLMENHAFSIQMQREFIREIEAGNPKCIVYVSVPTSWLQRADSHQEIFRWLNRSVNGGHVKLVGVVEILRKRTIYHWEQDAKLPARSEFWIAIFERID